VSVPVRGTIKAPRKQIKLPDGSVVTIGDFTQTVASEIGERLITLEKHASGVVSGTPSTLPGIPGVPGSPGLPGAPGAPGVSDHGALTGLLDDDHPQYVQHGEQTDATPHVHGAAELYGLEARFEERVEALSAPPHVHLASDVLGIEPAPLSSQPDPHVHSMRDLVDYDPAQIMLFIEVFGG